MPNRRATSVGVALVTTLALSLAVGSGTAVGTVATVARPSDFDGDGYADLAIGVPGEDVGAHRDAGAINVLYGASGGLTASGDQVWTQDNPGIKGTSEGPPTTGTVAGDAFGSALASADFDRDGHADLAIGAPLDRVGDVKYAGGVNVLYGTAKGLSASSDQRWAEDVLADAAEAGDNFGRALATGDFDGDGYPDLAIGVPGETLAVDESPGMVVIILGSATGLVVSGATTLTRAMTGASYETDSPHGFGSALAAGDLDGDGFDDLAVSAPRSGILGDDPTRPLVNGEVSVFYGSATGLTPTGSQTWTQDSTDVPGTAEGGDAFGSSLAIGDFDDDGNGDLAIGVRFDRVGLVRAGAVNVLYGTSSGLSGTGAQLWDQDVGGVPGAAEAGDDLGAAVAAGDLNGDRADDLAIGAPGEAVGSTDSGAGLVNVLYGSASGLAAVGAQAWTQGSSGVPGTPEATDLTWDAFGTSVAIGQYGRSSRADLAIGVPHETVGSRREAGMVNVLYGTSSGLRATGAQGWTQDTGGVKGAAERFDGFGGALTP